MPLIDPFKPVVLTHPGCSLTVEVLPLGLNVHRIVLQDPNTHQERDIIAGPENPIDHHTYGRKFFGPVVGRYANRLPKGRSAFPGGGHIDLQEWRAGDGLCLHGGPENEGDGLASVEAGSVPPQAGPFDRCVWSPVSSPLLFEPTPASPSSATFAIISIADINGYPGTLRVEARLEVLAAATSKSNSATVPAGDGLGALRMEYRARIIDACEATPLNMTHHWGFTLDAPAPIDAHTLRLIAPPGRQVKLLEIDDKLLPTGKLAAIAPGSTHDFASTATTGGAGSPLGRTIGGEPYDHFYVWGLAAEGEQAQAQAQAQADEDDATRCILACPRTRLALAFRTNQAGCQFFSTNKLPAPPADAAKAGGVRKTLHGGAEAGQPGEGNGPRCAAMLEFGMPHGTFLHQALIDETGGRDTVLRQGETYSNWVEVGVYATPSTSA